MTELPCDGYLLHFRSRDSVQLIARTVRTMSSKQRLPVKDAVSLAESSLQRLGYTADQARIIADHLIDSELRGFGIAGLARVLSIADRIKGNKPATTTEVTRNAPATAQIDGKDTLGYLVGYEATRLAIEKCKASGVAVVGANGTWYTGQSAC